MGAQKQEGDKQDKGKESSEINLTLNCREAELLLASAGHRADAEDGWSYEEAAAYRHYNACHECLKKGIASLARVSVGSCRQAAEIAADASDKTGLFFSASSIIEKVAQEHIYGLGFNVGGAARPETACGGSPCKEIAGCWRRMPFSTSDDDCDKEAASFLPRLISLFYELSLPLDVLFEIQKKTIKESLKILASVHGGPEEKQTIMLHLEILQQIVLLKK